MELSWLSSTKQRADSSTYAPRAFAANVPASTLESNGKNRGLWIALVISIAFSCILGCAGGFFYYSMQANISSLESQIKVLQQSMTKSDEVISSEFNDSIFDGNRSSGGNLSLAKESGNKCTPFILGPIESQVGILWKTLKEMRLDFGRMHLNASNFTQNIDNKIGAMRIESSYVIQSIMSNIGTLNSGLENVKQNLKEMTESGCGGIVEIPTTQSTFFLKYKSSEQYSNNERCFWIVETTKNGMRFKLRLGITLVSHGFADSSDAIYVFQWNRAQNITSRKLVHNTQQVLTSEGIYFLFSSDGKNTGNGFSLRFDVLQQALFNNGSNWYYQSSPGSHEIKNYGNNDAMSIAIHPKQRISFSVSKINTEGSHDYLQIYDIRIGGAYTFRGRLEGNRTNPLTFTTSDPILCIFSSDGSVTKEGFHIAWKP